MTKEEILEKSRKENKDEGIEYVDNSGKRYGVAALCIMFVVLAVLNICQGKSNSQLLAISFAYLGGESWGIYKAGHQKSKLVLAVIGIVIAVVYGIIYATSILL